MKITHQFAGSCRTKNSSMMSGSEAKDGSAGETVNVTLTGNRDDGANKDAAAPVAGAYVAGPSTGVAVAGEGEGAGAMVELSAGKAGVNVGPLAAELNPNLNTGAGLRGDGAEVSVLGFGASVGKKTGISTPLGFVGFKFSK